MAPGHGPDPALRSLRLPLALTRAGMLAEHVLRAFWPLFSVLMLALAVLMLGLHDMVSVEVVWGGAVLAALGLLVSLVWGIRTFHWPTRAQALARLDETLPGRPIQALMDRQAIGATDAASAAVWQAHQARMAARAASARPVRPDLRISRADPFALRYVATLALAVALIFGSVWRVGSVAEMTPGGAQAASGPTWEGWIEPPRYTGKPTIYLADIPGDRLDIPQGSRITLRFYGEVGALTLAETVSGRIGALPPASEVAQEFDVVQNGEIRIDGPGGKSWEVAVVPDAAPQVSVTGAPQAEAMGTMTLPFTASDDYGVVAGSATIAIDLSEVDRRYGLTTEPDQREPITVQLPMPIAGDRSAFTEKLIEDFSEHPWANLPVTFTLDVQDAAGQTGQGEVFKATLPGRRFFDPLAASVIEQRRDLLWARGNAHRVSQLLKAVSYKPEGVFRSETAYLRMRVILRRLDALSRGGLKAEHQEELGKALWDLAVLLEDGDLSDALERLRRAQERLTEAMKNGASDQEIAELMQELRRATDDYIRQLSRQAQSDPQNGADQPNSGQNQNSMQMSQNDLQKMMDRIQELMEQGRMAEAQQALEELQQLMENMRVTQGQGGGQSQGQQAMEGLADTLRNQQGLSDEAFRDLQEQFNPGANSGESQGNQGRNGGQGRGRSHEGQGGQGEAQNDGEGQPGGGQGQDLKGSLADRQQALRQELNRQQGNLPGQGTPEGDAARDALGRAGRAMDDAEQSLRQDDLAGAIDNQSEAMEALREGMRALGEALAQDQQQQPGQGNAEGEQRARNRDPLGRNAGSNGSIGTEENLLQGEDVYRRARELLDEIRRRSGDTSRPQIELDYLKRLLDRF
ncbi:TIGR02302 family protein [Seohaeicola zhoushanensis]|uniref:ATPase n=1 Tax=Seohaeicola zhoushanensis TaxID=1569283 RepID=A0A8J3GTG5_9RHOB|nr:TIGR02302 family protein [Seohaeicola zhoushanensis]GHF32973.1 ATPase [Seohaeicola zhoushanensis]